VKLIFTYRDVFYLRPDTALLRNGDPFWLPCEHGSAGSKNAEIEAQICLAVRINRVGKAIQPRFAHRYYDRIGLAAAFTDVGLLRRLAAAGLPWEPATCFDRSVAVSADFLPKTVLKIDPSNPGIVSEVEFRHNEKSQKFDFATLNLESSMAEKIALISRTMTLKMGDLIYIGIAAPFGVAAGDRIAASLGDVQLLDFQVK
jgi:2-keto-4-pentenoate hydratase/2-oxohepta-3-ene-1,7-dioic acid hydratase in catechol pathway